MRAPGAHVEGGARPACTGLREVHCRVPSSWLVLMPRNRMRAPREGVQIAEATVLRTGPWNVPAFENWGTEKHPAKEAKKQHPGV